MGEGPQRDPAVRAPVTNTRLLRACVRVCVRVLFRRAVISPLAAPFHLLCLISRLLLFPRYLLTRLFHSIDQDDNQPEHFTISYQTPIQKSKVLHFTAGTTCSASSSLVCFYFVLFSSALLSFSALCFVFCLRVNRCQSFLSRFAPLVSRPSQRDTHCALRREPHAMSGCWRSDTR